MVSFAARIVPKNLVELNLQPYRQLVSQDPFRESHSRKIAEYRREKDRAFFIEFMFTQHLGRPAVIVFIAQHELHFVMGREQREILPTILVHFSRTRRLDVY